jgi:hypothetical protein
MGRLRGARRDNVFGDSLASGSDFTRCNDSEKEIVIGV